MTTKLTLTLDDAVIKNAKKFASEQNTSLSKLVESYFQRISGEPSADLSIAYPPITAKLCGIAAADNGDSLKNDKELLREALEDKFL